MYIIRSRCWSNRCTSKAANTPSEARSIIIITKIDTLIQATMRIK
ncbi:5725_t:CDS:1, partial [Funneliformis caledonium]